jgi:DNA-binding winged helix-turn-helix (wHTH) protein
MPMTRDNLSLQQPYDSSSRPDDNYTFGEYSLDATAGLLFKQGGEVSVEPKVYQILLYLCRNSERYVGLQELHDNVWAGRVVSDAAVRRTISKARRLVNHDYPYIKSVHKKGYRIESAELVYSMPESRGVLRDDSPMEKSTRGRPLWLVFTLICGCILVMAFWSGKKDSASDLNLDNAQLVSDFPGEKNHLSVSNDGQHMVFAGKRVGFQGYQLFTVSSDSGKVLQLTHQEHNVIRTDIKQDGRSAYYVDLQMGASRIRQIDLDTPDTSESIRTLTSGFYFISDLSINEDDGSLYFSAIKNRGEVSQVYHYNPETHSVTKATASHQEESHDYRVAVSPARDSLAVATSINSGQEQRVTLYSLPRRSILKRFYHSRPVFDMEWGSENTLYLLDAKGLQAIDVNTSSKKPLLQIKDQHILAISVSAKSMLMLTSPESDKVFMELSLPGFQTRSQQLFTTLRPNVNHVLYIGSSDTRLLHEIYEDKHVVSMAGPDDNASKRIIETTLPIYLYDVSPSGELILMKMGSNLVILNADTSQLTYVTEGEALTFDDASFAQSMDSLYFAEKGMTGWVINQYNLMSKTTIPLFRQTKSIREFDQGYVRLDEYNNVLLNFTDTKEVKPLDIRIDLDRYTNWFVREHVLYWSEFDGKNTSLSAYNFDSGKSYHREFEGIIAYPKFSVDDSGESAIVKTRVPNTTRITKLPLTLF